MVYHDCQKQFDGMGKMTNPVLKKIASVVFCLCLLGEAPWVWAQTTPIQDASQAESVSRETIWQNSFGGPEEPGTMVAKSQSAWKDMWSMVGQDPPVTLNPQTEMGVAVFMGLRNTGGFSVEIVRSCEKADAYVIQYQELTPDPDGFVTMALTTPYVIQIVPRSDKPVVFEKVD